MNAIIRVILGTVNIKDVILRPLYLERGGAQPETQKPESLVDTDEYSHTKTTLIIERTIVMDDTVQERATDASTPITTTNLLPASFFNYYSRNPERFFLKTRLSRLTLRYSSREYGRRGGSNKNSQG